MKILLHALLLASLAAPAAAQCSLCPNGAGDLDRDVELFLGTSTCGDSEDATAMVPEGASCDLTVEAFNSNFNTSAVCCDSVPLIPTCSLCSGRTPLDPSTILAIGGDTTTCGEFSGFIDAVVNQTLCLEFQTGISSACCEGTLSNACSICPDGSVLGNPEMPLPLNTGNFTCGFLDSQLSLLPADNEICADSRSALSETFDISAFCGCSGVEPPGVCSFCGSDDLVIDPERQVGDFDDDDDGMMMDDDGIFESRPPTCGDFNMLAPFLVDEEACSDISELVPLCCEAARASSKGGKKGKKGKKRNAPAEEKKGKKNNGIPRGKKGKKR